MARDRYQCQRPGCNHARFLEIHHIIPRSIGGTDDWPKCPSQTRNTQNLSVTGSQVF
ncbi:MAG: HNH endonuclease [Gemmatimonadales bacterium]|nr:HNH endonuclease [Gemmatimonadales bacterium]